MSILVVDDNTTLLQNIVRSLVNFNFTVHAASSLREAYEIMLVKRPSVLCLDLQLPDEDGFDFMENLKKDDKLLPIIIVSGHDSEANRLRAAELGAASFLAKPFLLSELNTLLKNILGDVMTLSVTAKSNHPNSCDRTVSSSFIPFERVARAKKSFSTRRVDFDIAEQLITGDYQPQAGDLVLASVDCLNQHKRLELRDGRRATLFVGDEIIVSYGNRYAPDQFEAEVPADLSPCNLVAAGGIAAKSLSRNSKVRRATRITPLGVLADNQGKALNLCRFAATAIAVPANRPKVVAVLGTSMNAGKTTTAGSICLGMTRQGLKVGAAKVTGTGAGGDVWHYTDAGCHKVLDFIDCGYASTYKLSLETCEQIIESLIAQLCKDKIDVIVIEVADGILQHETRDLVTGATFSRLVDKVVFAAGDVLGARAGIDWLTQQGFDVIGVSGAFTAAPLAIKECEEIVHVPVLTKAVLRKGEWLPFDREATETVQMPAANNINAA